MTSITKTFSATSLRFPRALAVGLGALVLTGAIAGTQLLAGHGATRHTIVGTGEQASVMSQLNSEYLREIAKTWYPPSYWNDLNSEYLREISLDW